MAQSSRKVTILGGGMGALAAAWQLVQRKNAGEDIDISVHQVGWRLGGKCASSRNTNRGFRVEEHGLHVWFGSYDNAFRMIRHVYNDLGLGDFEGRFFKGIRRAPIMDCDDGSADCAADRWRAIPIQFPEQGGRAGDPREPPTLGDYVIRLCEFVAANAWASVGTEPDHDETHDRALNHATPVDILVAPALRLQEVADKLPRHSPLTNGFLASYAGPVAKAANGLNGAWSRSPMGGGGSTRLIRAGVILALAVLRGWTIDAPSELSDLDGKDLRDWLSQFMAPSNRWALESAPVRALYDLCFAYPMGDTRHGNFAAGAALHSALKVGFEYQGPFVFFEMLGGMGDVVIAPLYRYLAKHGVTFHFFHRVDNLVVSSDGQSIDAVEITQQAAVKGGREYVPLLAGADGFSFWPETPDFNQLENGAIVKGETPLDSAWWQPDTSRVVTRLTLARRVGNDPKARFDFNDIVLAIPPAELSRVGSQLVNARQAWRRMLGSLQSVQTLGAQLWMTKTLAELEWPLAPDTAPVNAAPEPLDVWADRTDLLRFQSATTASSLQFLCGPFPGAADVTDPQAPTRAGEAAFALVRDWLCRRGTALWPGASSRDRACGFDWRTLDGTGAADDSRLKAQFIRPNINPTDRYVLSVAGSTAHRLDACDSGFLNLYLAGDWVRTEWNAGCVEAAVTAGLEAGAAAGVTAERNVLAATTRYEVRAGAAPTVLVLGGGVGGLSAAHELIERGFSVTVAEMRQRVGGKARSIWIKNSASGGRAPLPGEHGFRFFPGFYWHLTHTMRRIPTHTGSVFDSLVQADVERISRRGQPPIDMPARFPMSPAELINDLSLIFTHSSTGLTRDDVAFFVGRLWRLMTMCPRRAEHELESISWWEFMGADARSQAYKDLLVTGLARTLLAAKADEAAARPGGLVLIQLIYNSLSPGASADRVLDGPTSQVWLDPWQAYLENRHVAFLPETQLRAINLDTAGRRVTSVTVGTPGDPQSRQLDADYYVIAVPVEKLHAIMTPALRAADPFLAHGVATLANDVEWMNGILFFLNTRIDVIRGHVTYIDSAWSLTSICQAQFWQERHDVANYGKGNLRDILSVVISNWDAPGGNGKTARECTPDEILAEVWCQLKTSLKSGGIVIDDPMVIESFIDPDVIFSAASGTPRAVANTEPLLVNKTNRWALRPTAETALANMFLASDYVKTNTNLATMEAANEAARRAVNGILARAGRRQDVEVRELFVPLPIQLAQQADCILAGSGALIALGEDRRIADDPAFRLGLQYNV